MTKIDPQPTKTGLGIAAVMFALLLSTIAVAPALVGPADSVAVEDRGANSVVIDNASDDPVTATVDAGIFTFNATVDAGDEVIVPADTPDDVTLHT